MPQFNTTPRHWFECVLISNISPTLADHFPRLWEASLSGCASCWAVQILHCKPFQFWHDLGLFIPPHPDMLIHDLSRICDYRVLSACTEKWIKVRGRPTTTTNQVLNSSLNFRFLIPLSRTTWPLATENLKSKIAPFPFQLTARALKSLTLSRQHLATVTQNLKNRFHN